MRTNAPKKRTILLAAEFLEYLHKGNEKQINVRKSGQ